MNNNRIKYIILSIIFLGYTFNNDNNNEKYEKGISESIDDFAVKNIRQAENIIADYSDAFLILIKDPRLKCVRNDFLELLKNNLYRELGVSRDGYFCDGTVRKTVDYKNKSISGYDNILNSPLYLLKEEYICEKLRQEKHSLATVDLCNQRNKLKLKMHNEKYNNFFFIRWMQSAEKREQQNDEYVFPTKYVKESRNVLNNFFQLVRDIDQYYKENK
jgi:hypothetical protein